MLTLTSQYALQALMHLARHGDGQPRTSRQIAEETGIPAKYLAFILGSLTHAGILQSSRGKNGGFYLNLPPRKICLYDIVIPFEPGIRAKRTCPFGNKECSDADPCRAHFDWKRVIESEERFLRRKTLHDVSLKQQPKTEELKR